MRTCNKIGVFEGMFDVFGSLDHRRGQSRPGRRRALPGAGVRRLAAGVRCAGRGLVGRARARGPLVERARDGLRGLPTVVLQLGGGLIYDCHSQ